MTERDIKQDEVWNRQKALNHLANMSLLHGVFYKGTYYHHGIGQHPKDGEVEIYRADTQKPNNRTD